MKLSSILASARLPVILSRFDSDLSDQVKAGGCPHCGGPLHQADYERKPRSPIDLGWRQRRRRSLCCGREGCRRRTLPPSTLFFGRRVYPAVMVILVTYLCHGATPGRVARLTQEFDIDPATLARWRRWWRDDFPATRFWRQHRATFFTLGQGGQEPLVFLIDHYLHGPEPGPPAHEEVQALLSFFAPLSTFAPAL